MRTKILSGLLLAAMVIVGLFLPSATSNLQDRMNKNATEQYAIAGIQAATYENTLSIDSQTSGDALAALSILSGEYMGAYYTNLSLDYDQTLAPAVDALIGFLSDAGLCDDNSYFEFEMVLAESIIATSIADPSKSATLLEYRGQSADGAELWMMLDLDSGKVVRFSYSRNASRLAVISETFYNACAAFCKAYYDLEDVVVSTQDDTGGKLLLVGRDSSVVEIRIIELIEKSSLDSQIRYTYHFN